MEVIKRIATEIIGMQKPQRPSDKYLTFEDKDHKKKRIDPVWIELSFSFLLQLLESLLESMNLILSLLTIRPKDHLFDMGSSPGGY
uniref:Uncharacterized protein n=1 Tax=Megaselia scalaris TaxID=36166 RepID=T1H2D2_MEGSC